MSESRLCALLQRLVLVAALGPCAAHLATADETKVFEWHEPNGVVSYSQKPPPPGTPGVTSRVIDTRSLTPAQRAAVRARLAGIDAAEQADSLKFRAEVTAADRSVARAVQALSAAEHAARVGRRPLAGERVGNAVGGSRLRSDYFDRQKALEDAVQEARSRVEEAYRQRNSITP